MKSAILDSLGQSSVLVPTLVQEGLRANDRAKVRLSTLQALVQAANEPTAPHRLPAQEVINAGLDQSELEGLLHSASRIDAATLSAPGVNHLIQALFEDVAVMVRPAAAAGTPDAECLERRFEAERAKATLSGDILPIALVGAMTSATGSQDSLHRLVMDLHKDLNRLAAEFAEGIVDDARVYAIRAEDRTPIKRFMKGLASTRMLKFDHAGLATTAARAGDRLIIQNDIGTTDAHVIVISVTEADVTVTYTDVHRNRAKFFVGLFDGCGAEWTGLDRAESGSVGGEAFVLVTGTLTSEDQAKRLDFLEEIGASLVFLIDWNKARKILRLFVEKDEAVALLEWAARKRVGHRGFLQLGGAELVNGAVRRIAATRLDYGMRLDEGLGRAGAGDYLRSVLRICAEGLRTERAERLIRDSIDAELARHIERSDAELMQGVVRQAGLARDIAAGLESALTSPSAEVAQLAERAKRIEQKADQLALALRTDVARFKAPARTLTLVDMVEDAIDDLEEAAFFLSLLAAETDADTMTLLRDLARLAVIGTQKVAIAADAIALVPEGQQIDSDDALAAIADLGDIEHRADKCERQIVAAAVRTAAATFPFAVIEFARRVERATDHLAWAGHHMRAHILRELSQ